MSQSTMNSSASDASSADLVRTGIFAGTAVVSLIITVLVVWMSGPKEIEDFGLVGEEFFPKFRDVSKVTSLSVHAISDDARPLQFEVEQQENGRWVVPTHHNYPADAVEQLADTATSVMGLKRGSMVTRWKADHAQYGVVDPEADSISISDVGGVGKRVKLMNAKGDAMVDFIVGKKVEDREGDYYVRHPDEEEVYITTLDINLTTKFTDWIDTDLFDFQSSNVVDVTANRYKFEQQGDILQKTETQVTTVSRPSTTDSWTVEGLNEAQEEINTQAVNDVINTVSNLQVAGVRPKQKGLTPDLRLDPKEIRSRQDILEVQLDLQDQGFLLMPGEEGSEDLRLFAMDGELAVATNDGLVHSLYFGKAFSGSTDELEIGFGDDSQSQANTDEPKKDAKDDGAGDENDGEQEDGDESNSSSKPGRYVFVRVSFSKEFLGEEPAAPTPPEMPAELKDAPEPQEGEEDPLQEVRDAYTAAQQKYSADKRAYDDYVQKVADGIEKAQELNARFAEWYYVVSGDEYDKLTLTREKVVREKQADPTGGSPGAPGGGLPNFQIPGLPPGPGLPPSKPNTTPPADDTADDKPADDKPADDKPADDKPADDKPADDKPADDKPADDKPADDKPADDKPADDKPADDKPADDKPADDKPAEEETPPASTGEGDKPAPSEKPTSGGGEPEPGSP